MFYSITRKDLTENLGSKGHVLVETLLFKKLSFILIGKLVELFSLFYKGRKHVFAYSGLSKFLSTISSG